MASLDWYLKLLVIEKTITIAITGIIILCVLLCAVYAAIEQGIKIRQKRRRGYITYGKGEQK